MYKTAIEAKFYIKSHRSHYNSIEQLISVNDRGRPQS